MSSTKIGGPRIVVVAIAVAVAVLSYVIAQSPVAGQAAAPPQGVVGERSSEASAVEAAAARTGLVTKLKAALGDAFGGVWFEPSTAQVHVGVTSAVSRRNAEAVAAQAGLAENVTENSVDSTWAQLDVAQERWNRRLDDLFDRGQVATSVAADHNSVQIELTSSVPSARRAILEQEAAADSVNVFVETLAAQRIPFTPWKQCAIFAKFKAYCDPPMVSGVSIDDEKEEKGEGDCTAGPTAIKVKPANKEAGTETFLLTAGHCFVGEGAVGKKWFAIEKQGAPKGRKEIGKGVAALNGEKGVDAGIIKMEAAPWVKLKDPIPLSPKIAQWDGANETDPFAVTQAVAPGMVGAKACYSGQRAGTVCGKIIKEKQTLKIGAYEATELLHLEIEGGKKGGKGDSGSPVFAKTPWETKAEGHVEGMIIGGAAEESEIAYYQPLSHALAGLKANKGYDLELLKQSNQKRHGQMKAGKYPATIHGSTTAGEKFTVGSSSVECKSDTFHAVLSEASSTLTVTPEYKSCTASFGVEATVAMEGCTYVFHVAEKVSTDNYRAYNDISCPAGKSIQISAPAVKCKLEIKAQNERETTDLIDDTAASPKKDVTVRPTVEGIAYTITEDGAFCPLSGLGEKSDGKYTSTENITVTGQNPSEATEKIDIEVADE
jgi:hypothetical protein